MITKQVDYNEIATEMQGRFKLESLGEFDILKIIDIPRTSTVNILLNQPWMKLKMLELSSVKFYVNEPINIKALPNMEHHYYFEGKILITIESSIEKHNFQLYWKIENNDDFYSLNIRTENGRFIDFLLRFLETSLKLNKEGILTGTDSSSKEMNIKSLGDDRDYNLLLIAAEQETPEIIVCLISLNVFEINAKFEDSSNPNKIVSAIDMAWREKKYENVFTLLNFNSHFPSNLDDQQPGIPKYITNFINYAKNLHSLIEWPDINLNLIEENLAAKPNLKYLFNLNNESAAYFALKHEKVEIYNLLSSKKIHVAQTDPQIEIFKIFKKMSKPMREKVKEIHLKCAQVLHKKRLLILILNSIVSIDDTECEGRLVLICEALNELYDNDLIRPLLDLVSYTDKLCIFFDFNRDGIKFLDPTERKASRGAFEVPTRIIYIGARGLLNDGTRQEVLGTLAHEFCHFASFLTYFNNAKPYPVGDSNKLEDFEKITNATLANLKSYNENLNLDIVRMAFEYSEEQQHAEIIVRIPHLAALDLNFESEKMLPDLFNFYKTTFLKDVRDAISMFSKHSQSPRKISWKSLTQPCRLFIKNSGIIFQGRAIKVLDLNLSSNAFQKLTCQHILKFFKLQFATCNLQTIQICKSSISYSKELFYLERTLMRPSTVSFEQFLEKQDKVKLISDVAGSGKTTALMLMFTKLKQKFKNRWIEYVDLKAHIGAFEKINNFETKTQLICFISSEILKLKSFESEIFAEQFEAGTVTFLFDGFDEISPYLSKKTCKIFSAILNLSTNSQIISTRPECVEIIEKTFKIISYNFKPLKQVDKKMLIEKYFTHKNLSPEERNSKIELALDCMNKIQGDRPDRNIINPLMLLMIARLSFTHNLSINEINYYTVFSTFYEHMIKKVYEKGDIVKGVIIAMNGTVPISLLQAHTYYALKLFFEKDFKNLYKLPLMNYDIAGTWKNEHINRYGILHINFDGSFAFFHRMIAEFLTAKFFIDGLFFVKDCPNKEEMQLRFDLLIEVSKNKPEICNFISNFLELNRETPFNSKVDDLKINIYYIISNKMLSILTKFFRRNKNMIKKIWKLQDDENFLIFKLRTIDTNQNKLEEIEEMAQKMLHPDEINQLHSIHNEMGNILFNSWKRRNFLFFNLEIERLNGLKELIEKSKSINNFLNAVVNILNHEELLLMLYKNCVHILIKAVNCIEDFEDFKIFINQNLSHNETCKFLLLINFFTKFKVKTLWDATDEVFSSIMVWFRSYLNQSQITDMVFNDKTVRRSILMTAIETASVEKSKIIWDFLDSNLNTENKKKFLLLSDTLAMTAFHHVLLADDLHLFNYFKNIYQINCSTGELKAIFNTSNDFYLALKMRTHHAIYSDYLKSLFEDDIQVLEEELETFLRL